MRRSRTDVDLDAAFAALADPTRRAIVRRLTAGEATVNELAALFPCTQQAVSRQVGVLRRAGLIEQRVDGQRRPCRLRAAALDHMVDWIGVQRRQWNERLDALETHLDDLRAARR
jgi:DNA-binding transcriptional ArsR family regulator